MFSCRSLTIALFLLTLYSNLAAQIRTDRKLQEKITALIQAQGVRGVVGVYVKNLRTGKVAEFQADSLFPTASMVKVPILVGVMDKIEKGELPYNQPLEYKDSLLYAGEDILGSFKSGEKIELSKVMMLMLTMSDNTASLWLQSLAGTGARINELLDSLGLQFTRVNSRTPGREENRKQYGWGQTTPREMTTLMEKIYRGEVISKKASERMLRVLGRNYHDVNGISQVPPYVFVASKTGEVNQSRNETLLVMAPHGPYVYTISTKKLEDQSWNPSNEGWVLCRKLSALLWHYFEPRSKWKAE
ncbi:serine hydrolase [Pseudoflavitalea sp. X16]|uniref:serine hydrolase n=1 Tax=Paraflavitalea devenefica TaxID=2716334 RepID=UPI00141E9F1F|nr:serine hydrolase [Paraflavitalea devenefica]NII24499.1 serine hydrolase [Paraflavitalea devenefica]